MWVEGRYRANRCQQQAKWAFSLESHSGVFFKMLAAVAQSSPFMLNARCQQQFCSAHPLRACLGLGADLLLLFPLLYFSVAKKSGPKRSNVRRAAPGLSKRIDCPRFYCCCSIARCSAGQCSLPSLSFYPYPFLALAGYPPKCLFDKSQKDLPREEVLDPYPYCVAPPPPPP